MPISFAKKFADINTEEINAPSNPQNAYNELFGITELPEIREINVTDLIEFENQPFKPYSDEQLEELMDSIKNEGQLSPIVVNDLKNGKYQILAGHNRARAIKKIGQLKIKAYVKDVDESTAKMIMLNSNLNQRHELLPSEKAFAYKMRKDELEKLGVHNVRTTSQISSDNSESKRNIQYFIRLTYLIPELINSVDENNLPFRAGVELSYLTQQSQFELLAYIKEYRIKLSLNEAKAVRELENGIDLTHDILLQHFNPTKQVNSTDNENNSETEELKHDTYVINNKEFEYINNIEYISDGLTIEKKDKQKLLSIQKNIEKQISKINQIIAKAQSKYN